MATSRWSSCCWSPAPPRRHRMTMVMASEPRNDHVKLVLWHMVLQTQPIGSMVLLYMVTWIPSIYPLYVSIYTIHGSYGKGKLIWTVWFGGLLLWSNFHSRPSSEKAMADLSDGFSMFFPFLLIWCPVIDMRSTGGTPPVISWFINHIVSIDISTINHS